MISIRGRGEPTTCTGAPFRPQQARPPDGHRPTGTTTHHIPLPGLRHSRHHRRPTSPMHQLRLRTTPLVTASGPCPTHHLRETQSPRPMGVVWAHHLRKPSNYGSRPLEGRLAETPRPESVDRHLKGPSVRLGLPTCPPRPCRAAGLASGSVSPVSAPAPRPEFSNRSRLYARPTSGHLAPDPDSSADLPSALPDPASRSCSSTGLPHPAGNLAPLPSPPLPSPRPSPPPPPPPPPPAPPSPPSCLP